MGDVHLAGAGLAGRGHQGRPVGVVAEHKTALAASPAPGAAHGHPAAGKGGLGAAQALHPGRSLGSGRRQHQPTRQRLIARKVREGPGGHQGDPLLPVGLDQGRYGPVQQHLLFDAEGVQFGQDPLGLAEGITKEHRGALGAALPPGVDLSGYLGAGGPAVDRQAEGGLADQDIGAHRLKGGTTGIGIALEITRDQPAFAAGFQANLGRAEHMAGTVE